MPRSIWNGTITFGLLAVPIKVHSATEDKSVHFRQVHASDGARIRQKRICSEEGREVPYKEVAKGYEVGEEEFVLVTQDEIDAAAGEHAHSIALEEFACGEDIDPVYYDRTYYLGAGKGGQAAYRLLHDALKRSRRVGVGRWVFHNREYLVAVRPLDGALALHTMRFADELVDGEELEAPEPSRSPTKQEVDMAGKLVQSLHERFRPDAFQDNYRQRVLELISAKARGEEVELPEAEQQQDAPDLMAALQASLEAGTRRTGARGRPRGKGGANRKSKARS